VLASPIADLTYRNYDGPLQSRAVRWWTVTVATIRANVNKTRFWYWLPAGLIVLVYLIRGAVFYFNRGIQQQVATWTGTAPPADAVNPFANELYGAMSFSFVNMLVFIAALVVGSASIAADNRANALLVYLSKPLTRFDYLFGKWMGVFLLLAGLILVPSLLMFLFFVGAYGSEGFLSQNKTLILRLIVASLIPALVHASLIIGFSAWTRSARVAGAVYAGFYLATGILSNAIGIALWSSDRKGESLERTSIVFHSSVDGVKNSLAQHVYDVSEVQMGPRGGGKRRGRRARRGQPTPPPPPPGEVRGWPSTKRPPLWVSLAMGTGVVLIPLAAARAKVKAVEVVRG
jgi:ABC-2 type transport system permease protein